MTARRKSPVAPTQAAPRPLKRPRQARARFTVQAIYDAFVRIWQRDGWQRLTTRNVALETGISVGTLYDYFPSKTALLSGYVGQHFGWYSPGQPAGYIGALVGAIIILLIVAMFRRPRERRIFTNKR